MDRKRQVPLADEDDAPTGRSKKLLKIDNSGLIDFSSAQNCYNVYSTDNRVDNHINNSRSVTNNINVNRSIIQCQIIHQQSRNVQEERVYKLLQMLSPLEPLKRHQDVQSTRLANTGTWLLELPRFQAWRDGMGKESTDQSRILCCYGMPGAGKTILSSLVIDHVHSHVKNPIASSQAKIGIACLYGDYRDQRNQTLDHIIGSFLQQFLLGTQCIPQTMDIILNALDDIQKQHKNVGIKDILSMLKLIVQQLDCTYICIDALHELNPTVCTQLLKVLKDELGSAQLFLTGRYTIQADLSRTLNIQLADHIDIKANPDDIRAYLISQIEQDTNPDAMNERLQEEILTIIPARSQGMFLLPALHIAAVLVPPTIAKRRKALENLPTDLYDIFQAMIERIQQSPRYAQLGMQVLMWLHLAYRPLKLTELAHALAVKEEDTELDEDDIPSQTTILASCIGLVIIDDETSTVRFVHYTLEEFFRKNSNHYFPDGISYAAEICLRYLNFGKVRVHCSTKEELERKQYEFAFLTYAACNWGYYVKEQSSDSVKALALRFIGKSNKCHCAMQALYYMLARQQYMLAREQRFAKFTLRFSAMHAAAYFGIEEVVHQLVMSTAKQAWDFRDDTGRTPLSFAAENGHKKVVRLLVDREDVVADSKDNNGLTPLSWAACNGKENVVRLLVDREDVVADSKDNGGKTPLSWAAWYGHGNIVQLLIDREDVVADSKDNRGRTPLSLAACNGKENVVRLLVDREDVVADSKDNDGLTPLYWAAWYEHENVVQLLVDREDVVADLKDNDGLTLLSWAARRGKENVVRLLVGREDVVADSKDNYGRTPLSLAAWNGHENVVQLLVGREDVVADSKDNNGLTPLSWAAERGHENIVQLLVDREDVVADSKDNNSRTPLSWAAERGHENIVQLLVDREDVVADSKDNNSRTPLSWAAERGHENIVQLLVDREDVVADSKDNYGQTPLSWAAERGHENIVQLLVDREDVVADSKDNYGQTPLSWAAERGHENVVRLLVDREDVVADSKDNIGGTPLSSAAWDGHENVVRLLVDREDVMADSKDNDGRTPLSFAAWNGHENVVQLLVDREDVVADSKDNNGRTPLSSAAERGHKNIVQLLVGREDMVADSEDNNGRTPL